VIFVLARLSTQDKYVFIELLAKGGRSVQNRRQFLARKVISSIIVLLLLGYFGIAQNAPQQKTKPAPQGASEFIDSMAQRLSHDLNVKTVIGEPIKVGSVTLIPILMIDVKLGAAAAKPPSAATAPQNPASQANLVYMSGEARPLGFVAITGTGTRFISVVKLAAK
jgi:uncharacterized spore protein YtfJ